jgi:hypothetical protein
MDNNLNLQTPSVRLNIIKPYGYRQLRVLQLTTLRKFFHGDDNVK